MTPIRRLLFGAAALVLAALTSAALASGPPPKPKGTALVDRLTRAVGAKGIERHLAAFSRIANRNGGTRASGTEGYQASLTNARRKLDSAGYETSVQRFDFDLFREQSPSELERTAPTQKSYVEETDFSTMEFSGSGEVTAPVTAVDVQIPPSSSAESTSGCEPADFGSFPAGNIALLQRGTCPFGDKADNAEAAGAAAAIIFNEGQAGRRDVVAGTLGESRPAIPVLGATYAAGQELAAGATARVSAETSITPSQSKNLIADTPTGREGRTVVVGSHLDSVLAGPGINDNGSGSAQNLELALQMARLRIKPKNQVRFAFWGAEESGLIGSTYYVEQLSRREKRSIDLNLNFDMVGSPNFARLVYDGDGDAFDAAGPRGSGGIERAFERAFSGRGLVSEPTEFDGRSDYAAFIEAGIPAGGLFSGAEGIKTARQAKRYGGDAGEPYDACYHQSCDTLGNTSSRALEQFSDAAAEVTLRYAMRQRPVAPPSKPSRGSSGRESPAATPAR